MAWLNCIFLNCSIQLVEEVCLSMSCTMQTMRIFARALTTEDLNPKALQAVILDPQALNP